MELFKNHGFSIAFAASIFAYTTYSLMFRFADYLSHLGANETETGLIISSGIAGAIALRFAASRLTAKFELRNLNFLSALFVIASSIVFLCIDSLSYLLFPARILYSVGIASLLLSPMLLAVRTTEKRQHGEVYSMLGVGSFIGIILGTVLSDVLRSFEASNSSFYQTYFILNIFCASACAIFSVRIAKSNPKEFPAKDAITERIFIGSSAFVALAFGMSFLITTVYLTRYLSALRIEGFSLFFVVYAVAAVTLQFTTRRWGNLFGHHRLIVAGLVVLAFGQGLLVLVREPWHLVFPALVFALGRALAYPSLFASSLTSSGSKCHSTNNILLAYIDAGTLLFAPICGFVIDHLGFNFFLTSGSLFVFCCSLIFAIRNLDKFRISNLKRRESDWTTTAIATSSSENLLDLVHVLTEDGVRLDGSWYRPAKPKSPVQEVDAVILVHGNGDNFYRSSIFDNLSAYFLNEGLPVLRINTRGHGTVSMLSTQSGNRRVGTSYEKIADSLIDFEAWEKWAASKGYKNLGFVGHSGGAIKALYNASFSSFEPVWTIALSPPRLSYSFLRESERAVDFLRDHDMALKLVQENKANQLMEVKVPFPYLTSAKSYLDKYGREELYNLVRFHHRLPSPALVLIGGVEMEELIIFKGWFDDLKILSSSNPNLDVKLIGSANHVYTKSREEVITVVDSWLNQMNLKLEMPEVKLRHVDKVS